MQICVKKTDSKYNPSAFSSPDLTRGTKLGLLSQLSCCKRNCSKIFCNSFWQTKSLIYQKQSINFKKTSHNLPKDRKNCYFQNLVW